MISISLLGLGVFAGNVALAANDGKTCDQWQIERGDRYCVTFQPYGAERVQIYYRDSNGRLLGTATPDSMFDLKVEGEQIRQSMANQKVVIARLLDKVAPYQDQQGKLYIPIKVPYDMPTREGRTIPAGAEVMLDLNDFTTLGHVQPTGAYGSDNEVADRFNQRLRQQGSDTRPSYEPPDLTPGEESQIAAAQPEQPVLAMPRPAPVEPAARPDVARSQGSEQAVTPQGSFPWKFLSSPVCECRTQDCLRLDGYGPRVNPATHRHSLHEGIDFQAPTGTRVVAAADGCVRRVTTICRVGQTQCGGRYGNFIALDHGGGYQSVYAHLSTASARVGQCFRRGEEIGRVGNTGRSVGPHLHFELIRDGQKLNPQSRFESHNPRRSCSSPPSHPAVDEQMRLATGGRSRGAGQSGGAAGVR